MKISIFKRTFSLTLMTLLAQAISVILTPLIANMAGPEIFGQYQFIWSAATIVSTLIVLELDFKIVKEGWDKSKDYVPVIRVLSIISAVLCTFLILPTLIFTNIFNDLIELSVMMILAFTIATFEFSIAMETSKRNYQNVGKINLSYTAISQVLLLLSSNIGSVAMTVTTICARYLSASIVKTQPKKATLQFAKPQKVNFFIIKDFFINNVDYTVIRSLASVLQLIASKFPIVMGPLILTKAEAGVAALALIITLMPQRTVINSISRVVLGEAAFLRNQEKSIPVRKLYVYGFLFCFLLSYMFFVAIDHLLPLILSAEWTQMEKILPLMALLFFSQSIPKLLIQILNVTKSTSDYLKFVLVKITSLIIAFYYFHDTLADLFVCMIVSNIISTIYLTLSLYKEDQ